MADREHFFKSDTWGHNFYTFVDFFPQRTLFVAGHWSHYIQFSQNFLVSIIWLASAGNCCNKVLGYFNAKENVCINWGSQVSFMDDNSWQIPSISVISRLQQSQLVHRDNTIQYRPIPHTQNKKGREQSFYNEQYPTGLLKGFLLHSAFSYTWPHFDKRIST